jgi:short-subunit dehydrogenase
MQSLLQAWRRRWWRPDPTALAAYAGLKPMTVVTGASEGIGYALARRFAAAGNDLVLVARRPEVLRQAADRIRGEYNVDVVAVPADVTTPAAIPAIEAALAQRRAYADVLVNSAGMGLAGAFLDQPPEAVLQLLDLNVRALTELMRHFLPAMRTRGRGGILNLASLGGYAPGPYQAVYYASKAYVISLSEAVAAETAGEGVRVSALAPGPVNTRFHEKMGSERSFYRILVPPASAKAMARAGYRGFAFGWRVIVPGIFNPFLALAMRVMPHRIVIPIIGWLLKPRGAGERDVRGQVSR